MASGVVREWNGEDGWGVLDSDETPGGCWLHYSSLDMAGYRTLRPGQHVSFTFAAGSQDGYDYRAETVWLEGVPRALPPGDSGTPGGEQRARHQHPFGQQPARHQMARHPVVELDPA